MAAVHRVIFPYRNFGPYHVARLAHACEAFQQSGMALVPVELFAASRTYRWSAPSRLDNAVQFGLNNCEGDKISYSEVPKMLRMLEKLAPAAIFVNGWGMRDAIFMHGWCIQNRVPRILVSDSSWQDKRRYAVLEFLKKLIVRGCEAAFVGGNLQMQYIRALGMPEDRIFNGCDVVDNHHFALARSMRNRRGRRLLTVARFQPEKNLVLAARAFLNFASQRTKDEDWHWMIVGYGSEAGILADWEARSQGRITIDGYREYEEMPSVYADADIYFQPSVYEPWGLVINEAMAAGLPVLVSNMCGCVEELVSPEVGWIFDPHSESGIVAGLHAAALGFDRWQTMGEAAAARIGEWNLDRFSQGAVQAALMAISQSTC